MARATPSYEGLKPASAVASRVHARSSRSNTRCELALRSALWKRGLRFRTHAKDLPGRPDIVFRKAKVAIFCDGDFWHGKDWPTRRAKLKKGTNASYWVQKIQANMARDQRRNDELTAAGWRVLRFWESDIRAGPEQVADRIAAVLGRAAG